MKIIQTLFITATIGLACMKAAADVVEAGRTASQEKGCVACHGEKGISASPENYPHLAGQHASYLTHSLKGYRDGSRKHAIMNQMAAELSDDDIEALAAFYAAQDGLATATRD
ncbi:MAG: cytochrome c [Gammaproteobacteria bacterium]